ISRQPARLKGPDSARSLFRQASAWLAEAWSARRRRPPARLKPVAPSAIVFVVSIGLVAVVLAAQGPMLDPALLMKPPVDAWPTYHTEYSRRRYGTPKQIHADNG